MRRTLPSKDVLVRDDLVRVPGKVPDDKEGEGVESEEGERGLDVLGEEEDREGTEELSEVGAADHDLRVRRVVHDSLGNGRSESVLL